MRGGSSLAHFQFIFSAFLVKKTASAPYNEPCRVLKAGVRVRLKVTLGKLGHKNT